jgi:hypothetical protein
MNSPICQQPYRGRLYCRPGRWRRNTASRGELEYLGKQFCYSKSPTVGPAARPFRCTPLLPEMEGAYFALLRIARYSSRWIASRCDAAQPQCQLPCFRNLLRSNRKASKQVIGPFSPGFTDQHAFSGVLVDQMCAPLERLEVQIAHRSISIGACHGAAAHPSTVCRLRVLVRRTYRY